MLSAGEKDGATVLLQLMEPDDIIALARTITKNQIMIQSADEANHAIITYSINGVDLLKRRKIKRQLLFQYLFKENVAADPSSNKIQLARKVLEHWGTSNVDILDLMEVDDDLQDVPNMDDQVALLRSVNDSFSSPNPPSNQQPNLLQDIPQQKHSAGLMATASNQWVSDFMAFEQNIQTTPEDQQMGQEFAKWFYRMLNACNPSGETFDTPFGTQHFFPSCKMNLALVNMNQFEEYQGAEAVCEKFLHLVRTELLLFCANVDAGGIMSVGTPHGMKIFIVCGTLHKEGNIVGVFAQHFGLVRNPERQFNWNIKFTNLKLIAGVPLQMPTLQNPGLPQT